MPAPRSIARTGKGTASKLPVLAGFECASHRLADGRQIDSIAASGHDRHAAADYALLAAAGIGIARDGMRWHLIEAEPGRYDWSSADPLIDAARAAGVAVIWDLCHWGWPAWLDIWSDTFVRHFAKFAVAAVERIHARGGTTAGVVPVNEISFWAWAGGEHPGFAPHGRGQGNTLKRQLVLAWLAAVDAMRAHDPALRIISSEPLVVMHPNPGRASARSLRNARSGIHQAWDMLLGRREPELGGHACAFDVIGVNWYPENQWRHMGRMLPLNDPRRVPLADLLVALHRRYRKPMLLTETGREEPHGAAWLQRTVEECRTAIARGADIEGACLYPAMDYAGWADARHCQCGLIEVDAAWSARRLRPAFLNALRRTTRPSLQSAAAVRQAPRSDGRAGSPI